MTLFRLLSDIRACTHCAKDLPCAPRSVLQAHSSARLRIIGQAPGRKVHETGIPWDDKSGDRLREWLGITPATFYDAQKIAIIPMGFCYPGKAKSGDKAPRPECAPRWHTQLMGIDPEDFYRQTRLTTIRSSSRFYWWVPHMTFLREC